MINITDHEIVIISCPPGPAAMICETISYGPDVEYGSVFVHGIRAQYLCTDICITAADN